MLAQGTPATTLEASVIAGFNTKLLAKISSCAANNAGVSPDNLIYNSPLSIWLIQVKILFWDSHTAFTTILNSPTTYGFVDAISYGNIGDFWG